MKIYRLHRKQALDIDLDQAWRFFWTPHNLQRITPDFLHFRITSAVPDEIHAGLIITYRIAAVAGIPMTWVTEIKHVTAPHETGQRGSCQFVDEQRLGPFRFWHHLHRFTATEDGIEVEDIVHYAMPWGWLGSIVHAAFIGRRLERIFEFRRNYLDRQFNRGRSS